MRRSIIFLCFIMTMCFPLFAAMPNFGGTWTRDVSMSDAMASLVDGEIRPVTADLVIKHADGKMEIETRWAHKAPTTKSYILDGNENKFGTSSAYVASWEGAKLMIDEKMVASTPFGRSEKIKRSEWSLSDGGATLTIVETTDSSSRKQVYHR